MNDKYSIKLMSEIVKEVDESIKLRQTIVKRNEELMDFKSFMAETIRLYASINKLNPNELLMDINEYMNTVGAAYGEYNPERKEWWV